MVKTHSVGNIISSDVFYRQEIAKYFLLGYFSAAPKISNKFGLKIPLSAAEPDVLPTPLTQTFQHSRKKSD